MTEQEWLSAHNVIALDLYRSAKGQHRKWRLFAAACCRRAIALVADARLEPVADVAERFADAEIIWEEVKRVRKVLAAVRREIDDPFGSNETLKHTLDALEHATGKKPVSALGVETPANFAFRFVNRLRISNPAERMDDYDERGSEEERKQLSLARDIFGNPFRPVAFSPAWRTEHTTGVALRMYDERDFAAMPILADALEEAGCENADILAHCREPGGHVRGCWVIDLVLGKE